MKTRESLTLNQAIEMLNEMVKADPDATLALINTRVACSKELAEHHSIQVDGSVDPARVGFLGVLNGLFGINEQGWGAIAAVIDEHKLIKFRRTIPKDWGK